MTTEQTYFDALRKIARDYMTLSELEKKSEQKYGLTYHEALEMAYENIQAEAKWAIKGKRRPKS